MPQWIRVSGLPGHVGKVVLRPRRVRVFGTQVVFARVRDGAPQVTRSGKVTAGSEVNNHRLPTLLRGVRCREADDVPRDGPELDNSVREMSIVEADVVAEPPDGLEITREPFVGEIRGGACHVEVER